MTSKVDVQQINFQSLASLSQTNIQNQIRCSTIKHVEECFSTLPDEVKILQSHNQAESQGRLWIFSHFNDEESSLGLFSAMNEAQTQEPFLEEMINLQNQINKERKPSTSITGHKNKLAQTIDEGNSDQQGTDKTQKENQKISIVLKNTEKTQNLKKKPLKLIPF